jgi:hypothetical protein
MMKIRAWGAVTVAALTLMACGSSKSGNTGGTGGKTSTTTTTTTSVTVGTGATGGGGGGSMDPVCSDPNAMVSNACITCINNLAASDPCIGTFSKACEGSAECVAYDQCIVGCHNITGGGTGGAGGGSTMCAADPGSGGSGGAGTLCVDCCVNSNQTGSTAYVTDLIDACICSAGAPCASACAM